jgi:predicted transcriptional regulator
METNKPAIGAVVARNIKLGLVDQNLTKNTVATRACIPSTTFYRNLETPEKFTLKDLGAIAEVLGVPLVDLLKDAA